MAKFFHDKLKNGSSRCISFSLTGGCAGRSSPKNWKRTIHYAGKSIGVFFSVVNQNGKKEGCFVASSSPLSGIADSAFCVSLSVPTVSSPGYDNSATVPASPDKSVTVPVGPDRSVTAPASPDS